MFASLEFGNNNHMIKLEGIHKSYKNALENVALSLYYQKVIRKKRNRMVMEYLEQVGLKEWAKSFQPSNFFSYRED